MKHRVESTLLDVINLWKEKGYGSANFQFACGGDSMGDTEWTFFDKNGKPISDVDDVISSFLEEEVYNKVNFYECSDGHYQGEFGDVEVTLEDDADDFDYIKSAQSEWSESFDGKFELKLTEKEASFLSNNIIEIGGDGDGQPNINYRRDFILSDEDDAMLEDLLKQIQDGARDLDVEGEGEEQEWFNYSTEIDNMSSNILTINVTKNYRIIKDSEG